MRQTIASHCVAHLMEHGPTPLEVLADEVKSAGLTRARDPRHPTKQALAHDPRLMLLYDGVYDAAARMLEGSWFTTRTRYRQPGRRQLFVDQELGPLVPMVVRAPVPLHSGGRVEVDDEGPALSLVGPAGWLPDCEPGGLIGLQLRSGELVVEPVEVDEDSVGDEVARVRSLTTRHAHAIERRHYRGGDDLGRVILSALVEAPDLLHTPLPPLDEVLALPFGVGPSDWSQHLLDGGDHGATIELAGVPPALLTELKERAHRMGITPSEYVVLQLAADAWRWQPPCVHDLRRQRQDAEMASRTWEAAYDEEGLPTNVIQLGDDYS